MSERKVLQKYFPPSFDPSLIKRRKMPKDRQEVIRLMAPFSMRCATCGEYIYKGKKFNGRKETVQGEEYYGIKIFRFYIKCTGCSAEITFKTDPKNTDYVAEHGAARNFEPWRDPKHDQADADKLAALEEEENNPMAALEHKAVDSKREMDILDALQDLKSRNARLEKAGRGEGAEQRVLDRISTGVEVGDRDVRRKLTEYEEARKREEEEDEDEIRRVFGRTFVDGVPDIGLGGAADSSSDESDGPATPGGDEADGSTSPAPEAGTSKAALAAANTAAVKRKLDAVEPTAADLLSAAQRSIIANSFGANKAAVASAGAAGPMGPPPKKKGKANAALAAKLGIKVKAKP